MTAKQKRVLLQRENRSYPDPDTLVLLPKATWPVIPSGWTIPISVWRSSRFMVQVFQESNGNLRLSVNRTELQPGGEGWCDGITWDELQGIKRQVGYADKQAVEIYPRDCDLVNISNMRHLWILSQPLGIGWFHA